MILNSRKGFDSLIVINDSFDNIPFDLRKGTLMIRAEDLFEDIDNFIVEFETIFIILSNKILQNIDSEPRRLFNKQEYAASVVSAVTLFEDVLRNKLDKEIEQRTRLYSLSRLLALAFEKQLINHNQIAELKEWIIIRNKFVHTSKRDMSRQLASRIIDSIEETINYIRSR